MVKRYGGVPLILKAQQLSDSPEELYPKRAIEEAVYQFILDEMNDIIDNRLLPDAYGAGRSGTTDTLCRRRIEKPSRDVRG